MARSVRATGITHYADPLRQSSDNKPSSLEVIGAVADFASTGHGFYKKFKAKQDAKIEADKQLQVARALRGQLPTSDSSKAGRTASYLARVKVGGTGLIKKIAADPNLGRMTDEELRDNLEVGIGGIREKLAADYADVLSDSADLDKSVSLQIGDLMPELIAAKASSTAKMEHRQDYESAYGLAYEEVANASDEDIPAVLSRLSSISDTMNLSPDEFESIVVQLADTTGKKGVFDFAKKFKGSHDQSLFSRSSVLQKMVGKKKRSDDIAVTVALWNAKDDIVDKYRAGAISDDELDKAVISLYHDYGNTFSESEVRGLKASQQSMRVEEGNQNRWIEDFHADKAVDFIKSDGKEATAAEKAATIEVVQLETFNEFKDALEKANTPEGRQNGQYGAILGRAWQATIRATDRFGKRSGVYSKHFTKRLNNIANANIEELVSVTQDPAGRNVYSIEGVERTGGGVIYEGPADDFNLLTRIPVASLENYVSGESLAILQRTREYLDTGKTEAEALVQAKRDIKHKMPTISGAQLKNIDDLLDNPDNSYYGWREPMPESAKEMMRYNLATSTMNFNDEDYQLSQASEQLRSNYTFLPDGSPIKGDRAALGAMLTEKLWNQGKVPQGSEIDVDEAFLSARQILLPFARVHFQDPELTPNEIQFDVTEGTVSFVSGTKVLPYRISLGDLGEKIANWRAEGFEPPASYKKLSWGEIMSMPRVRPKKPTQVLGEK